MVKKFLIRLFILFGLLVVLNALYSFFLYPKDLAELSAEIVQIRSTQDFTDVYYFGESSNVTYKEDDSLKNSISEFASWFYPDLRFTTVTKYATHAGIYKSWLSVFDTKKPLPKALIVTMNLRSFNAGWRHSDLETQLQQSVLFARSLPPLANRFLLSLQFFDNKTSEQRGEAMLEEWRTKELVFPYEPRYKTVRAWDDAMAAGGYVKPDGSWDMDKIVLACHYIKGYAFNVDVWNPRIKDFDDIAEWCETHKVKLYLNLMSENVSYADSLVGKDLVFLMKQNRDYLVRRYNGGNTVVIDNLERVKGIDFIDQKWTTEHYNYRGRMAIGRQLADSLKKQLTNYYKKAY